MQQHVALRILTVQRASAPGTQHSTASTGSRTPTSSMHVAPHARDERVSANGRCGARRVVRTSATSSTMEGLCGTALMQCASSQPADQVSEKIGDFFTLYELIRWPGEQDVAALACVRSLKGSTSQQAPILAVADAESGLAAAPCCQKPTLLPIRGGPAGGPAGAPDVLV